MKRLLAKLGFMGRTTRTTIIHFIILCVLGYVVLLFSGLVAVRRDPGLSLRDILPWFTAVEALLSLACLWLGVRRFHDQDRPGWLALVPTAAWLLTLVLPIPHEIPLLIGLAYVVALFLPPTRGPNRYGRDPRGYTSRQHYLDHREQQRARR